MQSEHELLQEYKLKRLQRAAEYALLATMHVFFLMAFHDFYRWWMALLLAGATFGMNFQLTQLREQRRLATIRERLRGDTFESVLFLIFIVVLSGGGLLAKALNIGDQEYLAYIAAILGGLFLAGLLGEIYWQAKHFGSLDEDARRAYITHLKRTIILPYTFSRRR